MNAVQTEAEAAVAHEYEDVLAVNGQQAEGLRIDGVPVQGTVVFDKDTIELITGGLHGNITAVVRTLKRYFPDGRFPVPFTSTAELSVDGQEQYYQVQQLNGERQNWGSLVIGLGDFKNRKNR